MEFVLASLLSLISLEENDSAALVAGREVVAGLVEFDSGDDIRLGNVFYVTLVTKAPREHQSQLAAMPFLQVNSRAACCSKWR